MKFLRPFVGALRRDRLHNDVVIREQLVETSNVNKKCRLQWNNHLARMKYTDRYFLRENFFINPEI